MSFKSTKLIAIAGLVLQGTAWGQGTIAHVVPSQPIYYGPVPLQNNIDINGDGIMDFSLISDGNGSTMVAPLGENRLMAFPEPPPDLGSLLVALPQGYSIGCSLDPAFQWYDQNTDQFHSVVLGAMVAIDDHISIIGFFTGLQSAYAAFDLYYDGASHYGWMQISNPLSIVAGQVVDWAYETRPGVPIRAGAKPVPVPLASPQVVRPSYLRLKWVSEIGKAYQVQSKARLETFAWTNLGFVIPATSTNSMVDLPISGVAQFFRVVEAD